MKSQTPKLNHGEVQAVLAVLVDADYDKAFTEMSRGNLEERKRYVLTYKSALLKLAAIAEHDFKKGAIDASNSPGDDTH